jgi:hypothetical protein
MKMLEYIFFALVLCHILYTHWRFNKMHGDFIGYSIRMEAHTKAILETAKKEAGKNK